MVLIHCGETIVLNCMEMVGSRRKEFIFFARVCMEDHCSPSYQPSESNYFAS